MNTIESNFVPYQIALDMKSIGFNEPCFGFYNNAENVPYLKQDLSDELKLIYKGDFDAPTFSQAFRFFREKYKLKADVTHTTSNGGYTYTIWKWNFDNNVGKWERIGVINSWLTYEEAELECLKKLIELCKKN
jgi:hypothetical protein